MQVFFDLPALVTILHRFLGLILHFTEWMFGIAYSLANDFQRFCHDSSDVGIWPGTTVPAGVPCLRPIGSDWRQPLQAS